MRKFFIFCLLLVLLLTGCQMGNNLAESEGIQKGDTKAYVAACFEIAGFVSGEWKSAQKNFLAGTRFLLPLDQEGELQITAYEYPTRKEASEDALCIHKDGFGYSREEGGEMASVLVEWVATPHFYLYENLILEYIGDNWKVIDLLESNFGAQIAGGVSPREEHWDVIPMVMLDDKYYYDTGLVSTVIRCGNADGTIDSSVESWKIPTVNGQSNFGAPYPYQYGVEEDTIEVCIDGEWIIFEHRSGDGSQVLINGEWVDANLVPDTWGLEMGVRFTSATQFEIVFNHTSSAMLEKGTLATGPEYALRVVTESKAFGRETVSFGEYMRGLGYDYADPELAWDTVLYTIAPDGETVIDGDMLVSYGTLPVGEYLLSKSVQLTTEEGETLKKIYTATFFVTE